MSQNPLVNIAMVTYNQGKYVQQAIESVLGQKTTFPFLLVISDDCSADDTYEICLPYADNYPDKIILLRNDINLGLAGNYQKVFKACTGKYISILEGDDYWVDELKLQKQTDILENNPDIGMVHSAADTFYEDKNHLVTTSKKVIETSLKNQGKIYEKLIRGNFIYPLTALFRRDLLMEKINFQFILDHKLKTIDYFLWLGISLHSKIAYMKDVVGVYRIRSASVSNNPSLTSKEDFFYTKRKIVEYYLHLNPVVGYSIIDLDNEFNEYLFGKYLINGDYEKAHYFGSIISKRSVLTRIRYLFSITKFTAILYSKFSKIFRLFR